LKKEGELLVGNKRKGADGEQLARRLLGQVRGKPDEFGKPARRYSRLEITDADGFADFAPDCRSEAGIIEAVAKQQAPEQPFFLSLERGWYHRDPGPYYYADLNYAKTHNSENSSTVTRR